MAAGAFLVSAAPASAGVVTDGGDTPMGVGTLRTVLGGAVDSDVITFDPSVTTVNLTQGDIQIDDDITLTGNGASVTTIDASGNSPDNRVFRIAPGTTVTIEKVKLTGGEAPDGTAGLCCPLPATDGQQGGGIVNQGTLTLDSVIVTGNSAGSGGMGGPGLNASFPGIPVDGGVGGAGNDGGGIWNDGTLDVIDSTISNNTAGAGGTGGTGGNDLDIGGLGANGGAGGAAGEGGGIFSTSNSSTDIENSTISGNHSGAGGAGGAAGTSTGGTAGTGGAGAQGGHGGGIFANDPITLTNSTVSDNQAGAGGSSGGANPGAAGPGGSGGGIVMGGTPLTGLHATIAGNATGTPGMGTGSPTPAEGGGLFLPIGTTTLKNTLVVSNTAGNPAFQNCFGAIALATHSISFGGTGCPISFGTGNPLLGQLQNNGGPTETRAVGLGGAAVDAVPVMGADCAPLDQRGVTRPQLGACDIGAFELEPAPPVTPGTSPASAPATASAPAKKKCKKGRKLKRGKCVKKKKK